MDTLLKICEGELRRRKAQNPELKGFDVRALNLLDFLYNDDFGVYFLLSTSSDNILILRRFEIGFDAEDLPTPTSLLKVPVSTYIRQPKSTVNPFFDVDSQQTLFTLTREMKVYQGFILSQFGFGFSDFGLATVPPPNTLAAEKHIEAYSVQFYT